MTQIAELRRKILDRQLLPYTHKNINVAKFLEDNQQFFDRLSLQIAESKKRYSKPNKSKSVSKLSISRQKSINSVRPPSPSLKLISTLNQRNQFLQKQIKRLKEQNSRQQIFDAPHLLEKQQQINKKSNMIQMYTERNKQIQQVLAGQMEMFDLYEKMCRKCENVRKVNNQLSEQLKKCIKKMNQLTGKDENPNLFIMNFK